MLVNQYCQIADLPVYMGPKEMPELPPAFGGGGQPLRDAPKKGFELAAPPSPPPAPVSPVRAHTETTTKKKALKDNVCLYIFIYTNQESFNII